MPALRKGHCNWCGGKLRRDQLKLCSPHCRQQWDVLMRTLGHKLAERALHKEFGRRDSPLKPTTKRAGQEMATLTRNIEQRLKAQWREQNE